MLLYEYGGNTRPYAVLKLDNPLNEEIAAGTEAYITIFVNDTTTASSGGTYFGSSKKNLSPLKEELIYGTTMYKSKKGSQQLQLLYKTPQTCRVGAKMIPVLDGCKVFRICFFRWFVHYYVITNCI
jgi:hypothetical protein